MPAHTFLSTQCTMFRYNYQEVILRIVKNEDIIIGVPVDSGTIHIHALYNCMLALTFHDLSKISY